MQTSDVFLVIQWWFILFILGVGFAPLTFFLFDKFFDKGYIFSKLIGLLITGYVVFVLGVLKLVPFTSTAIFIVFGVLIAALIALHPKKWKIAYDIKHFWRIFLFEELLFFSILLGWAYIHSFAPDIHGLEKFMDFGFINSFLRSEYLPAKDMWFTPLTINYYYFGHLLTAMLTKMSAISSAITFNLMLSSIVAFCFVETFSIGANLYVQLANNPRIAKVKTAAAGILSALLVTFAGNLHVLYAFFKPYKTDNPQPLWQLQFSPLDFPNSYWYPNATRFIYNTIHEFPIYSWVVADLHGHVLDIPFVLLIIAFCLSLCVTYKEKSSDEKNILQTFLVHPFVLVFIGFLLACMYMTNAWDGAIYLLLVGLVLFYVHSFFVPLYKKTFGADEEKEELVVIKSSSKKIKPLSKTRSWKIFWGRDYLLSVLLVVCTFFIFSIPYTHFFNASAIVKGIGVLCAPPFLTQIGKIGPFLFEVDHCQKSLPWELVSLYGFFYFFVIIFSIALYRMKKHTVTDIFVFLLILVSTLLIIAPEFVYLKDIYPAHYRANTMFKLVFQAFIMLGICSAYIIFRTFNLIDFARANFAKKLLSFVFGLVTLVLVYLVLLYPYLAVKAYYGDFKTYKGLNGVRYLQSLYPSDYEAIAWLNDNVVGQPVVLEAQGDSYTDFGRVSSNTGLPTVLGWTVHEWLWRGSYDIPSPRITEVKDLYESSDINKTRMLIKKYNIQYVFIGTQEYQKYPTLNEEKFKEFGNVVFEKGTTKLYKLRQ